MAEGRPLVSRCHDRNPPPASRSDSTHGDSDAVLVETIATAQSWLRREVVGLLPGRVVVRILGCLRFACGMRGSARIGGARWFTLSLVRRLRGAGIGVAAR
jgi:hypothetical protein